MKVCVAVHVLQKLGHQQHSLFMMVYELIAVAVHVLQKLGHQLRAGYSRITGAARLQSMFYRNLGINYQKLSFQPISRYYKPYFNTLFCFIRFYGIIYIGTLYRPTIKVWIIYLPSVFRNLSHFVRIRYYRLVPCFYHDLFRSTPIDKIQL